MFNPIATVRDQGGFRSNMNSMHLHRRTNMMIAIHPKESSTNPLVDTGKPCKTTLKSRPQP